MRRRAACAPLAALTALALAACSPATTAPHSPAPHTATQHTATQRTAAPAPLSPGAATPTGPAPSVPPASPTSKPPTAPAPRTVTILGSGDVLVHPPLWRQAHADAKAEGKSGYDFGPIYASIAPDVHAADIAICELETPLAKPQGPFRGWPRFQAPPQVLTAIKKIGYDSCTTASNHTLDDGVAGVKRTLDELDAAGLEHTGSARSAAEAATPLIITTKQGVKVAQLAYSFGFNQLTLPPGKPWLANRIDIPKILAAAHRARRAGADIVVLSLHWGTEYDHLATRTQRRQAATLLASPDIDVILGDHAHVVQPMQKIHGKWVVYCMGNQIARHADPIAASREGIMPEFTFTEQRDGRFRVTKVRAIPTWMRLTPKLRLIDLPRVLRKANLPAATRTHYEQIVTQIDSYVAAYGAHVAN